MTQAELEGWAERHGMSMVPIDEYERLIDAVAADMVAQAETHNAFEANHINSAPLGERRSRQPREAAVRRPAADG